VAKAILVADDLAAKTGEGKDNATAATVRRNLIASLEDIPIYNG